MEDKMQRFARLLEVAHKDPASLSIGERLFVARTVRRLSQPDLAEKVGVKYQTIQGLENNKAQGSRYMFQIARALDVGLDWLAVGHGRGPDGPMTVNVMEEPQPMRHAEISFNPQSMPLDVPVLGGASCGDDGLFEFNGQILDHVRRPPRMAGVKDAYALYVHGTSMSPWREPGQLVYVHPHQPVSIGDYVVVQMQPEGESTMPAAYIKRLVRRTGERVILAQFNPREEKALAAKKVKAVHRIVDWSELMGV